MTVKKQQIIEIINKSGIKDASVCGLLPLLPFFIDCRAKSRIPKNAKSVIVCIFPYKVKEEKPKNISRYSAVPDYHTVVLNYLNSAVESLKNKFNGFNFEPFVDNSPVPEVRAGVLAGLGVKGDNGLLINEKYGSFIFIGEIVTDLEIETEEFNGECLHCGNCKKYCPKNTGIECLSAVTQKKKDLTDLEKNVLKKYKTVWGCDICSDVCPMNENAKTTYIKEFIRNYRDEYVVGEDISNRAFNWRGEKVIVRNAGLQ